MPQSQNKPGIRGINYPNTGQSEDLLKQLQDQKLALDQSAIVAQTDARGKITMVNDQFCLISGFSRDELIGKDHRVVNSTSHPKEFFKEMWATISSGRIWQGEICNRKKTGELYWVATTITPFLDAEDKPYQFLAIRQDITALKEAERIILEQQAQLVASSRLSAIGEMAAAITHEINNPLTFILGRAEIILTLAERGPVDPENLKRLVDTIMVTGKRIEKIVRSMKSLAHQGEDEEPFTVSSMREILLDSLELCSQRFRNHGVRLIVPEIVEDIQLECRSHQLVQVIVNLLNNSHDAVMDLEEKWTEVKLSSSPSGVELSVTDSGNGIPADIQAKLFTPFFSTKRVQYGSGLGLSISQSIINNHNGKLIYDTKSPHTRFVIHLPHRQGK
ncbi:MAG: PAS domain-containing sensor histidine kinase [Bdellovibrionales bacterium]